jgi:hypothetical protein
MSLIPKYVRSIIACIGAFFISSFIFSHYLPTPTQFDVVALKKDYASLLTSLSSFHFEMPHFELISQKIEPSPTPSEVAPTMAYEQAPTTPPSTVTIMPTNIIQPTYAVPTVRPSVPVQPTQAPQPTKIPKPTKGPDVFPIDPSKKRPGETVDDIIAAAAAKACAPKEVLRTLASIESGGFFDTVSPKYLLLYNSENWWNSEFITEEKRICSGYAYDGNTGIVFSDSKYAGYKCREGSGSGLAVVGVMSLSPYLYGHYKDQAAKAIGSKNIDRRIIFDSLVIAGMNIKENTKATTCTNWDARTVVKAACSYYGSCGTKDGTYYCATFCRNYQKYGGKDCSGAIAQFTDSCWK